jgi:hypothetical protein
MPDLRCHDHNSGNSSGDQAGQLLGYGEDVAIGCGGWQESGTQLQGAAARRAGAVDCIGMC